MVYKPQGRKFYLIEFEFQGQRIRKRTKAVLAKEAKAIEAALRTELERGNYGILKPSPSPTLSDFLQREFLPYTESFQEATPKTTSYYQYGVRLLRDSALVGLKLDEITSQHAAQFINANAHRKPSTINCGLRTLRRALALAVEWGKLSTKPHLALAKGERQRDRVLSHEEAQDYLTACPQPWRDIATLILGTGMRPGECYPLRWEHTLLNEESGLIQIAKGKTKAARRLLPLVPEAHGMLKARWYSQGRPSEGWIFPAPLSTGPFTQSSAKNQHRKALKSLARAHALMESLPDIAPFEPYCLRHTALTQLGEGCDAFTLAGIAGHSSIVMTARYIHPQAEAVERAFQRMAGKVPTKSPTETKA